MISQRAEIVRTDMGPHHQRISAHILWADSWTLEVESTCIAAESLQSRSFYVEPWWSNLVFRLTDDTFYSVWEIERLVCSISNTDQQQAHGSHTRNFRTRQSISGLRRCEDMFHEDIDKEDALAGILSREVRWSQETFRGVEYGGRREGKRDK